MSVASSAFQYSVHVYRSFLLELLLEWQEALSYVLPDRALPNSDWGPSQDDVDRFQQERKLQTFSTSSLSRSNVPHSTEEGSIWDMDIDEETYHETDAFDDAEILEMAEQIEIDNSTLLVLNSALSAGEGVVESPSKKFVFDTITFSQLP